ncbi:2-amino-4-hydroxy-6-hydroxymethyldihydropteridine diphosphokinase [Pseudohongiella spirulinae]|uniref:2-amino-4-hydroxy-6-hydroxymethyldihydropteridine diphosphokinase n=1 Tax=Pseudohongiella spirulinae TaxID=1249552 RepID=A0A0S2KGD6_9GAMM|nr:2-amino-4-hydroxy-6-hydroxymethyldihydropteridine diphosphokinase [Pseudohongiella spirulinae]ALO47373.1 2-amino-4-hydroxy-6-hydroxymethyldihydropteridine pyrophosphokinase [Pseudohongiella spirulinae]
MTQLTLSLGSNQNADYHIRQALTGLQRLFGPLTLSSVFESEAVGFDGSNFLNMVVAADTTMPLKDISHSIKALEDANGRRRDVPRFSARTLDIDILTFGDLQGEHCGMTLPRPEITRNAFVLWPMAQICGDRTDPHSGKTYQGLWQAYDKSCQRLWPVDFSWQGQQISAATAS